MSRSREVDAAFTELPLQQVADAALQRAHELGAEHADLRVERVRRSALRLRDGRRAGASDTTDAGLAVRVVVDGTWGFSATADTTVGSALAAAEQAVAMARVSRPLSTERVELAPEPAHAGSWVSSYDVDPFDVPPADQQAVLEDWSRRVLAAGVDHVEADLDAVKEHKLYADLAGTRTVQQRVRLQPELTVSLSGRAGTESMRSLAPPVGRGLEYLVGTPEQGAWDWDGEVDTLPELVREKLAAPGVEAGSYDLVIDPSNLWLTIHESVGHATELDRALGYEAAYAGTSFATHDQLGTLRYGSDLMHVTGDRTVEHGLATTGWDDEGVATQSFDIVRAGTLVGYQLDRRIARLTGLERSNGCAFADSPSHVPIQRMANVSLQPAAGGPSTDDLVSGVERGFLVVGDRSWSIDMQRYNFQFTGQRFHRIQNGRLVGMVKDLAYQATTTDFWRSMARVGGPQTWVLGGAFNCGKGQPGQVAAVSHGCPSALFTEVRVLNTAQEGAA